MTNSLPPRPNLVHLKKQARALLRAHGQGDQQVCAVLRHLKRFADASVDEILAADVTLTEAQFALAMDYGFSSWTALKAYVDGRKPYDHLLHIHCGDSSADTLRATGVGGKVIAWYDPLLEGPTPAGVSPDEWLHLRAQTILSFFQSEEDAARALVSMDERLYEYRNFEEVVLWFDACLFDQTILIRQLDWFAQQALGERRLSLICIGEFPGHPKFKGLGELHPTELSSLIEIRHEVTAAETTLAQQAWAAYRAPDPTAVEALLHDSTAALPYLHSAFRNHLERFPSTRNGLGWLEQQALLAIAAGQRSLSEIMRAASEQIVHPYFGDTYLFALLEALTIGPRPLLRETGLEEYRPQRRREWWPIGKASFSLTEDGVRVLNGDADWITLHGGIDRWLGGVHLLGPDSPWRWDDERHALVGK